MVDGVERMAALRMPMVAVMGLAELKEENEIGV